MTQKDIESFTDGVGELNLNEEYGPGNERWEMRPLSELMEPVLGKTPKRSEDDYWGGDIKWASAKDVSQSEIRHVYDTEENMTEAGKDASNAKILPEGTVVVVARGSVGEVVQLGEPMTFNQSCYALDTNEDLLDDYLYYAWQYVFGQVQAVSYGTVFDTITMKSFEDIEIPVPPISIQEQIAAVLGSFDEKIEVNRAIGTNLQNITKTLFRDLFINTSEFTKVTFGDICKTSGGGTPKTDTEEYWEGDIFWLTPKEVTSLHVPIADNTERKLTEKGINNSSARVMDPKSVLLTSRATVGEVVMNMTPMATNQGFICIAPNENISPYFLTNLVMEKRPEIESLASGSTYPEISQRDFNQISIRLPPKKKRAEFSKLVEPMYEEMYNRLRQDRTMRECQNITLPMLLSGKIKI